MKRLTKLTDKEVEKQIEELRQMSFIILIGIAITSFISIINFKATFAVVFFGVLFIFFRIEHRSRELGLGIRKIIRLYKAPNYKRKK